jgi:hypothetical protein
MSDSMKLIGTDVKFDDDDERRSGNFFGSYGLLKRKEKIVED